MDDLGLPPFYGNPHMKPRFTHFEHKKGCPMGNSRSSKPMSLLPADDPKKKLQDFNWANYTRSIQKWSRSIRLGHGMPWDAMGHTQLSRNSSLYPRSKHPGLEGSRKKRDATWPLPGCCFQDASMTFLPYDLTIWFQLVGIHDLWAVKKNSPVPSDFSMPVGWSVSQSYGLSFCVLPIAFPILWLVMIKPSIIIIYNHPQQIRFKSLHKLHKPIHQSVSRNCRWPQRSRTREFRGTTATIVTWKHREYWNEAPVWSSCARLGWCLVISAGMSLYPMLN